MNKITQLVTGVVAVCFMGAAVANGVGVVDMEKVVKDSPMATSIKSDLEKQFAEPKKKVTAMTNKLQADMAKYQKNKAVMSKDDLAALEKSIGSEQSDLQKLQIQLQSDVQAAQEKKMKEFMSSVKSSAKKIADKKGLDLVLPANAVIYSPSKMDITKDVISSMS